ncbi:MAG: ABC transporter substrate-binding protein [Thaumarchaeota archaeon]|jgi:ABC-type amino acid transport substrate-binding protein|nr:ABC transporter substrate-binding protein [Candidatus Geocrenenecus arthurdayi]
MYSQKSIKGISRVVAILVAVIIILAAVAAVEPFLIPAREITVTSTYTTTVGAAQTVTQTVTIEKTVTGVARDVVWENIQKRGTIIVGTSPDWPPFEFLDPKTGKLTGFEVELMELIAERLGLKVDWKTMDFATIIVAVEHKDIDLGVSGFSVTPERLEVVQYTLYHSITESQLIMLKDKAEKLGITRLDKLEQVADYKLIVGTGSGTTQEAELMDLVKRGVIPSEAARSYDDFGVALEDLKLGRIDALYAETPVTTWWIMTEKTPLVVVFSKPYWPVAFIAHKDSDELVSKINGVLAQLIVEGKVAELYKKWTTPPS